jgi:hypothetical protein
MSVTFFNHFLRVMEEEEEEEEEEETCGYLVQDCAKADTAN